MAVEALHGFSQPPSRAAAAAAESLPLPPQTSPSSSSSSSVVNALPRSRVDAPATSPLPLFLFAFSPLPSPPQMESPADLDEWELLHTSDSALMSPGTARGSPRPLAHIADPFDPAYFGLDSEDTYHQLAQDFHDSAAPVPTDPESDWLKEQLGFEELEVLRELLLNELSIRRYVRGELELGKKRKASPLAEGDKGVFVWWKLPLEVFKFCAFPLKSLWSISLTAAIIGLVVLWRRVYRARKQRKRIAPAKAGLGDKKATQLKVNAAQLSEAFRGVSALRAPLPGAV